MLGRDTTSREWLLGWCAFESGAIDRERLVIAAQVWARSPERSLAQILAEIGPLDAETLARLEERVEREWEAAAASPGPVKDAAGVDANVTVDYLNADSDPFGSHRGEGGNEEAGGARFRVLRSRASGGLGEVFLALDTELNRPVAVKELQAHNAHDPASQARFLFEAEVTGRLEHPGIVPVYSLSRHHDGRPYYAMRLLEGGTLREAIERFHRMSGAAQDLEARELAFRRLLRSVIAICNAVAYAHSRGVVHRDLKPENVMLGRFGETLVVDWGLARMHLGSGDEGADATPPNGLVADPAMTRPGSLIGTPRYMSPEQASGDLDRVGPSSDIYSLGAILYCVLVGHDTFPTGDTPEVLDRVRRGIFPAPRRLRRTIDPTLEVICMKAMSLDPGGRHASALELAEELERWLSDVRYRAEHEAALIQVRHSLARLSLERAHHCFGRQAHDEGMLHLSRALEDAPAEHPAIERVVRMSLGGWHARDKLLQRRFRHRAEIHDASFCPEGRKLATVGADRTARLWDVATGSPLATPLEHEATVRVVAFRPDGSLLATAGDEGLIRLWDAVTGEPYGQPIQCGAPITAMGFSPDGTRIAMANRGIGPFLWDVATGRPVGDPDTLRAPILAFAFSPGAPILAIACSDGLVRLLDPSTGVESGSPLAHDSLVSILAFADNGGRLLTGTVDSKATVWDVARGALVVTLLADREEIRCLAFRPGGEVFATSSDGAARLRDSSTGRPIGDRLVHRSPVDCLAFRPDGNMIATGGRDGKIRLWCATSGLPIGPPLEHGGTVRGVVFNRDGTRLASRGADSTVRCWAIPKPIDGDPERVSHWVRVTTNLEFDEGEAIRPMDGTTVWDLRRRLDELGGPPLR